MPILLLDTSVEMQSALGTDITITGISKASEAVVTASNSLTAGDLVVIKSVAGMVEINNRVVRVKAPSGTEFTCEGLDSTNFTTYASGGVANEVSTLLAFDNATTFNFPEPSPNRLDATTIHGNQKVEIFGLDDAATLTMNMNSDPTAAHVVELRAASRAKTTRAFRVTLQDGKVLIFNAYVAGGRGLDGSAGAIATSSAEMTLAADEQYFTS